MTEQTLAILSLAHEVGDEELREFLRTEEGQDTPQGQLVDIGLLAYAATLPISTPGQDQISATKVKPREFTPGNADAEGTDAQADDEGRWDLFISNQGTVDWWITWHDQIADIVSSLQDISSSNSISDRHQDQIQELMVRYNLIASDLSIGISNSELWNQRSSWIQSLDWPDSLNAPDEHGRTYAHHIYLNFGLIPHRIIGQSLTVANLPDEDPETEPEEFAEKMVDVAYEFADEADDRIRETRGNSRLLPHLETVFQMLPLYAGAWNILEKEQARLRSFDIDPPADWEREHQVIEEKWVHAKETIYSFGHVFLTHPFDFFIIELGGSEIEGVSGSRLTEALRDGYQNYAATNQFFPDRIKAAWEETVEEVDFSAIAEEAEDYSEFRSAVINALQDRTLEKYDDSFVWSCCMQHWRRWENTAVALRDNWDDAVYGPLTKPIVKTEQDQSPVPGIAARSNLQEEDQESPREVEVGDDFEGGEVVSVDHFEVESSTGEQLSDDWTEMSAGDLVEIGREELQEGNLETALSIFKRTTQLKPNNLNAWYLRGKSAFDLKNLPEAESSLRSALELNANHYHARYYLGRTVALRGKEEDAYSEFQASSVEDAPQSLRARSHLQIARLASSSGDSVTALNHLEEALEVDSEIISLIQADPAFAPLREMDQYQELIS